MLQGRRQWWRGGALSRGGERGSRAGVGALRRDGAASSRHRRPSHRKLRAPGLYSRPLPLPGQNSLASPERPVAPEVAGLSALAV